MTKTNGNGITWENPPAKTRGAGMIEELLNQIKVRPHEWARIRTYARKSGLNLSNFRVRFPEYEFRAAPLTDGGQGLYAKYTPTT